VKTIKPLDTLKYLTEMGDASILPIVDELNLLGHVFETQEIFIFNRPYITQWSEAHTKVLESKGYYGGAISKVGTYYTFHGDSYCLYDTERHNADDMLIMLDELIKAKQKNKEVV